MSALSGVALRIYIMFLCINMVLVLAGFSVTGASNIQDATYETGDISDSSGMKGYTTMIQPLIDFVIGGGIMGMLSSAGLPTMIQLLVGLPFAVLSLILIAQLIKVALGFVS